jgi:chromosome segregation ATPase
MKRIPTPIWMSLAVAMSPIVKGDEKSAAPAPQPAAAPAPADAFTGLQKHFEAMNSAISDARKEAADVAGERDAAVKETEAVRQAKEQLEGQLTELRKQLENSNHEVWQWKDKATVLERKLGAGEQAFEKLAAFRDEMSVAMQEFATIKAGMNEIRGELQAPAERVALKKEIASLQAAQAEVQGKLAAEAKAHGESKRLLAASEGLVNQLKKGFEELKASAKQQLAELNKAQQERDALAKNLATTNEQLQTVRNEASGLKDAKLVAEKNLDATRGELTATREALASLQKESAELRSTMQPLAAEIQAVKDQASKATTAIQEASAAREKAEQARIAMETQLKEVNGQLAAALDQQNGLKQQVATKTQEVDGLRKKIEEMEAKTANKPKEEDKHESAGL